MNKTLDQLKREVILKRLQQRNGTQRKQFILSGIVPIDRSKHIPLSWAQQRLWFLDQLDHSAGMAYHMPAGLKLTGTLNKAALQATLNRIIERHENLRTTFISVDGQATQAIGARDQGFTLEEQDLSVLEGHEQQAAIERISAAEVSESFDLSQGPLIRGQLLRLSDNEHILLVTQHHIISDGWSIGILIREVSALYAAYSQGQPDPLPALSIQYADYAVWQRQWLQGEALQEQIDFWQEHLAGAPALLELPTDRARPAVQSYAGDLVPFSLDAELTAGLRRLTQRHGGTLFMTMLAGWSILLSRLSGQEDVVIGTAFANRQRKEIESLIGFFVNTLALRTRFETDPSVKDLLEQVKATTLEAYAHQDLPFEQVVEVIRPVRSMSHSPLFQAMLTLNNTPSAGELTLPGLTLSEASTPHITTHFDLSLMLEETSDSMVGHLEYASDLFDRSTIERMIGYFKTLLSGMVADEDQRISALPLLEETARRQVLEEFNDTAVPYPEDKLIHQLFEEQVAKNPEATALEYEEERVSYGELNKRANRLAHHLIGLGVKADDRVAICVERSIEMVVGLLGILKAGGGYVPLDPGYPEERLAYMLEDSAPVAILTQGSLVQSMEGLRRTEYSVPVVVLDGTILTALPEHNPDATTLGLTARHLAYVIYTSGSTGMPKGVMVEHGGLCNLAQTQIASFIVRADSKVLQFASFSFDASVSEIMMTLCSGASLFLASPKAVHLRDATDRTLREYKITHVTLPSSVLAIFPMTAIFEGLTIIVAGDVCSSSLARRWMKKHIFFNAYGPTEATICSTIYRCKINHENTVPIGRPIANTQIYILDKSMSPVPVGVAGEIYIGGAGVARGYLNRPELTAERFIEDRFSKKEGARMYKTGDLGRWLEDGNIEYLGRNDFQVKLRGFRIELGEIEAKLSACAGVREAVVLAREDHPGDKRLVAYVIVQEGQETSAAGLRAALSGVLPEYMVPSAYVMLERFPLTPNGKLDRKALPAPGQGAVISRGYEAPEGKIEVALATIWEELLGLQQVGRHDDFFELGGHSLMMIQLVSRIRQVLGIEVPVRELFAHPTVSGLAKIVEQGQQSQYTSIAVIDRTGSIPLSWAQQRLWFLDQLDHSAGMAYHMPAGLKLTGTLNKAALQATLNRIIERHENLRTTFISVDGQATQAIGARDQGFTLEEQDLSVLEGHEQQAAIERISAAEVSEPFDLSQGPLIRGQLLRLSDNEHILLVTQHHIISDGWSIGILIREVSALYAAYSQGQPDPLPALSIQYADYAVWQRQWLQGEALQEQIDFWQEHLAGAPALLELPTDRARPAVQSYAGDLVPFSLDAELTAGLRRLTQRHGGTLFMTMLAGWSILLSRLSGQEDVVIGTAFANRQRKEIESLIGFFVNTLALRTRFETDPSVKDLLEQVKATTLEAYAHQDLPFEQVVEVIRPVRSMSHSPLFQAMLTLNNTPSAGELTLPGLTLSEASTPHITTHFDLSLMLEETSDSMVGHLEYASDLFDRSTIERMIGYFKTLLSGMVADEDQRISALPLLEETARRQVLEEFNDTAVPYPEDKLIHQLFEEQVAKNPEATALEYEEERVSYGELNKRANRLAHHLIGLGVKADDRVAICVERSIEMVVGLLGILKAGGGYVPLDPGYPEERLAYMLEDSAPVAILTQGSLVQSMEGLRRTEYSVPVVVLDGTILTALPEHNPDATTLGLTARHLAYVIYTSGSTGMPKGVMNEHGGVINRLVWAQSEYCLTHDDRILQKTPFGFDVSVWEFFLPLQNGATLVMARPDGHQDPHYLANLIATSAITMIHFVPSMLQVFLTQANMDLCQILRRVICSGEALPYSLQQQFRERLPNVELFNLYGPTEAAIDVTSWKCKENVLKGIIPIGRPIANTQIYILDKSMSPVPVGVAGEIYIGGAGVARGYLNRPELTAERFIEDRFSKKEGARMYKTGDLGRWLEDGNIEYLGRNDFQVKLRGFRIELGEIEAKLSACAGVREAVVLAREDHPGDKRLVAYVIVQEGQETSAAGLRAALSGVLPEYMVPSAYVMLERFPLTPNGKLDRKALPAPGQGAVISRGYEAPEGKIEVALATIWEELLGLQQVGRHDDFFELGGHSLMAISLIERLRQRDIKVDVRTVFSAPMLADMANMIIANGPEALKTEVHENLIKADCTSITPDLLPLVVLEQKEIDQIVASVPGGVSSIQDIYPLAPLQEGILFHHLMQEEGDAYILRTVLGFSSRDKLESFLGGLQDVIDRHDILRSSIHSTGLKQPVQVVHRGATLPIKELLLSQESDPIQELLNQTDPRHIRLDLQCAPLLAAYISQDPHSGEWFLALLNHHIISDHVTMELIIEEIQIVLQGRAESLLPSVPYRNFIAQARSIAQAEHEDYFRQQLSDIDEPTAPFGVLEVQGNGAQVEEAHLPLRDDLSQRIRQSARKLGVTPAVLFHVAWAQVLGHCSGREDVVFGTVLSGRLQGSAGADRVLGMFINTLPIRISLAERNVKQVIDTTRENLSELLQHEQASLALAQRCSGVRAPMPLFTALLNYRHSQPHSGSKDNGELGQLMEGLRLIAVEERTNYPLTLSVDDFGTGFNLTAQCMAGIDSTRIVHYVSTAMEELITALIQKPEESIGRLGILSSSARRQVLEEFNDTAVPYPEDKLIHQLFEEQVAKNPEATALEYEEERVSYGELNKRANRLAHHLIGLGVKADDRVAICVERSIEMVVGLLGILKAGGGYVPLDPGYPEERLAYMLEDSAPVAILTQGSLVQSMEGLRRTEYSVPVVVLDGTILTALPEHNPDATTLGLTARHLAYVIYTSGSTGMPKGVMIEHRNVLRLAINNYYAPISVHDCIAHCANPAFDASTWEVWGGLLNGARILIISQKRLLDPTLFSAILIKEKVTALWLTSGLFDEYVMALGDAFGALKYLLIGGDVVNVKTVATVVHSVRRPQHVINGYGPTETTTFATTFNIKDVEHAHSIPIGRPIANTQIYILDKSMSPVPVGVAGEIYIGGAGVARGYLNRPELTAERFIEDRFSKKEGARMYKTGDLGRWLEDGNIEYLGRNDFQVKLRGFRIELGEIEAKLSACAGVREAVVLAREDHPGDKRLVAYVIVQEGQETSAAGLRAALSGVLPEYMVPSAYVMLERFPLTPNGKLDRKALPAPGQGAVISRGYEAPEGKIEVALATIWEELLGLQQVGRHDDFFELGGHSLMMIQLVSRIRQVLGIEVPVRELFAHPTVSGLAKIVEQGQQSQYTSIAVIDRTGSIPLSWAQQRLWFLDQLDHSAGMAYHMPAGLKLTGTLNKAALQATLNRIIERHENLRTTFISVDGQATQAIGARDQGFTLEEQDLSVLEGHEQQAAIERISAAEVSEPFDLSQGPLIRGQLLRLSDNEHILLVTQHHIISDGWSIGILIREVSALYAAYSQGQPDPLPALSIQYADYAVWQRQWLQGEALQEQIDFWQEHLAGAPALLELPTDRARPAVQSYAGDLVPFSLDAELTAGLRRLTQRHGGTLFMTMLAGWSILLSRLSGQEDVVIGTAFANRQRKEIESLIGFFVNTLALRTRFETDPSVKDLLEQVKATTLEAYAHQDLPFEQVVEVIRPVRSMSHSPLFQAMLTLNNTPSAGELTLPGLTLSEASTPHITTHFDLSLMLEETSDSMVGHLEYASDLFDRSTIERMIGYFKTLLSGMVADEDQRISALPLLEETARRQVLEEFNDTAVPYPEDKLIHQLFEEQVAKNPEATALEYEEERVSYGELNKRANRLAHHLIGLGVKADDRVAICVERSIEMVVGLLGILKAGGGYVPLDPGYPEERLAYMLEDSAPVAILTQGSLAQSMEGLRRTEYSVPVVVLDGTILTALPEHNPDATTLGLTARHLAYVIYTSGSTGMPKGVMIEHVNLVNFIKSMRSNPGMHADDILLSVTSPSFDIAGLELYLPLVSGARTILARHEATINPQQLINLLERQHVHGHAGNAIDMANAYRI